MKTKVLTLLTALLAAWAITAATPSTALAPNPNPIDWTVYSTFHGKNGEDLPLRKGQHDAGKIDGFGLHHIEDGHPVPESSLFGWIDDALEDGTYKSQAGNKVKVTNKMVTGHTFIIVFTERIDSQSGDGRPVGILTAYQS